MLQVCMFCCFNESNVHHLFEQSKAAQVKIVPQGFLGCAMPYFRKDKQVRFAYNLHTFHSPSAPTLPLAAPFVSNHFSIDKSRSSTIESYPWPTTFRPLHDRC